MFLESPVSRVLVFWEFPSSGRTVDEQRLLAKNMSMYNFFSFQFKNLLDT